MMTGRRQTRSGPLADADADAGVDTQ